MTALVRLDAVDIDATAGQFPGELYGVGGEEALERGATSLGQVRAWVPGAFPGLTLRRNIPMVAVSPNGAADASCLEDSLRSLAQYFDFYNNERRHQALMDRQTPWQAYAGVSLGQAA